MEHVFEEKDIGVIVDSDLTFEEQYIIQNKNSECDCRALIRRSNSYLDCKSFVKMYTSFVRPHIEYAQSAWASYLIKYINLLENVQIRTTKILDGISKLDYTEAKKKLNMPSLAYRRLRGDMIETYKHFHKYGKNITSSSFQPRNRVSWKHDFQLHHRIAKDGIRGVQSNSFYHRIVRTWNNLPREVVNATNVNTFKNKLDDAWRNEALNSTIEHHYRAIHRGNIYACEFVYHNYYY